MTLNSALKKDVRARMAATGENYTTALRAMTAGTVDGDRSPLAAAMRPGTMTLVINGGGQQNAALVLPELVRLARAGHPLILAPYTRSEGVTELPSLVDFLVVAGKILAADAAAIARDIDALMVAFNEVFPRPFSYIDGPMNEVSLVAEISRLANDADKPPVLYVQDVQEAGAVAVSPYDDEVAQVARLRNVAEREGVIVAGGHCMPSDIVDGWEPAAAEATEAFVIDDAPGDGSAESDERDSTLVHVVGSVQTETIPWPVDLRPFGWRPAYYAWLRDRS